jgi:hypothetical protein
MKYSQGGIVKISKKRMDDHPFKNLPTFCNNFDGTTTFLINHFIKALIMLYHNNISLHHNIFFNIWIICFRESWIHYYYIHLGLSSCFWAIHSYLQLWQKSSLLLSQVRLIDLRYEYYYYRITHASWTKLFCRSH